MKAFTLIELLIAVLIIGVLTAIALPQYEKAVEKSRATQAITLLKSVVDAAKVYHLTNGIYPTSFDELDVRIPWTGTTMPVTTGSLDHTDWKSNEQWTIMIYKYYSNDYGILIFNNTGKYKGAGFLYFFSRKSSDNIPENQLACVEYKIAGFKGTPGDYCIKIFNGKKYKNSTLAYTLP